MTLREFYRHRWHESLREHNPLPLLFSQRDREDREGDRLFACFLFVFYWLPFPLWVIGWLRAERACRRTGHDWDDYYAPGKPRLFAECSRCGISYHEHQALD